MAPVLWIFLLLAAPSALYASRRECSGNEYDRCIRIADPLVKEARLIFPDNLDDINLVCRTWNRFVDCLKIYTDNCFTDQQRRQFNKAVENPIESVHRMCTQPGYQEVPVVFNRSAENRSHFTESTTPFDAFIEEYLQYAPCIKNTITQRIHCGPHYNLLVDQVSQGEIISKSTLCCSHDRFKQCVMRETRRLCDRGAASGPASRFSAQIIDKALSFLQDQCFNYIPNSGDCTTLTTDSQQFSDPLSISTSPSEVYPWSTVQREDKMAAAGKEVLPSRITPPKMSTTSSWLPSSRLPIENSPEDASPTQVLGSRTRPASYGRSNSWSDSPQQTGTTAPMYRPSELMTSPSSMSQTPRRDWSFSPTTTVSWQPQPPDGSSSTVTNRNSAANLDDNRGITWYPAAGDQLNNEVDEPNQQGLIKPQQGGVGVKEAPGWLFGISITAGILTIHYQQYYL